jgi:hypothetical protein
MRTERVNILHARFLQSAAKANSWACVYSARARGAAAFRPRCREMLLNGFYDVKWSSLWSSEHVSALEIERRRYSKSEIINGKDAVDSVQRRKIG